MIVALCRALLKEMNGDTKERRIMKLLGKNYFDPEKLIPLLSELISELDPEKASVGAAMPEELRKVTSVGCAGQSCRYQSSDRA